MPESPIKSLLITNATVVSSQASHLANVYVEDGVIKAVGDTPATADHVIDATGLHLFPGVLDPQVHFRDPGLTHKEDLYTGSCAAAAGGVTSFFEMPNTNPNTITRELMAEKKAIAAEKCVVNYNFFIGATPENLDEVNACENVPGIKIFVGSSTGSLLVHLEKDLDKIFGNGHRLIAVHSEDELTIRANTEANKGSTDCHDHYRKVRTPDAALKSTALLVGLSKKYNRRLHILHLSTQEEAEYLAAEKDNPTITVEVCPQHMFLRAPDIYDKIGVRAQMNPPLRDERHGESLVKALKEGTIDIISSDHAPHTVEEKDQPYGQAPSGMPGVEAIFPVMLDQVSKGTFTAEQVCQWMCEVSYEIFDVPNKGKIAEGYHADMVLVDMNLTKPFENGKVHSKTGWTPYHGMDITGWPVKTFVHGEMVFEDGKILADAKGKGREIQFAKPLGEIN